MKLARAFTLIELLVVVTIIAVLAALVLGAMNVARDRGDAAQCASNLRQLVIANLGYAAEHDGHYVPAQEPTNTIRWHGVRNGSGGKFDPTKGPLAPYLGAEGRVKLCPALRRVLADASSFEDGTGGYGYNATYIGGTPPDPFTSEQLAKVAHPSATMMFADCAFPRANGLQEYAYAEPWQWVDYAGRPRGALDPSVHFRHGGYASVAWCDGRISAEAPTKIGGKNSYGGDAGKWVIGWFGAEAENGAWNPQRTQP
jgi:prepilin-type N-terminal cleavage/methylation domain-containing protein/prepilin-type processing-associated H-X9-DG protein